MLALPGETVIPVMTLGARATTRLVPPLTLPMEAVIVTVPALRAVASPPAGMVLLEPSELDHVTVWPLMVAPCWSDTIAVNCCVAPTMIVDAAGPTAMADTTLAGGWTGEVPSLPHPTSNSRRSYTEARTRRVVGSAARREGVTIASELSEYSCEEIQGTGSIPLISPADRPSLAH
jgi:hypothetical protein